MLSSEFEDYPDPPSGCSDEDFLNLIDLCPFLASDRIKYNDKQVLALLQRNPRAACLRAPFHRFGIGTDLHPLALVVALGGSLDVVKIMVKACPAALGERLSGRRTLLHYAISEGVDVKVMKYLVSQYPEYLTETDSHNAIPLHLAVSYPSSSLPVLQLLLDLQPYGVKSLDNQSQTPLHRACKSRASLDKVMALVEVAPYVLSWVDWCGNTPLGIADRMDHRLGDVIPEVVSLLELVEEIMSLGSDSNTLLSDAVSASTHEIGTRGAGSERKQQAAEILTRFRFMGWKGGIPMSFLHNTQLYNLMGIPTSLTHEFVSLICGKRSGIVDPESSTDESETNRTHRLNAIYTLLKHHPQICEPPKTFKL